MENKAVPGFGLAVMSFKVAVFGTVLLTGQFLLAGIISPTERIDRAVLVIHVIFAIIAFPLIAISSMAALLFFRILGIMVRIPEAILLVLYIVCGGSIAILLHWMLWYEADQVKFLIVGVASAAYAYFVSRSKYGLSRG
jgi:hypothetical protein